ncbi:hypothetical protein FYK55_01140 [Roseiconus nitratireducens]|uniref:Uncharacterized protein n=1 Tax=Roseiconus nitratireducens TaxID=2605748 RepID=A0A5M6DHX4_9BACT|nr:hypothetical protein [Roseiconus nitratireducens]KAA5547053.1 hypothetical protein FYK55_01140 [Roseiconus nitratireducens]
MGRNIWMIALALSGTFVCKVATTAEPETYLLRYSLTEGQRLNYEVTHVAKTKTRLQGKEESSQVHTVSQRHWQVADVNDKDMTFDHVVDSVEMTQKQGDQEEVRWSSTSGELAPPVFAKVAERIGHTLSTVSINARGQETNRVDNGGSKASLGMGSLSLALPEEPIAVGDSWSVPREIKTRTDEGLVKPIKIRELYTLEKVSTGVATLSIRSEPLTPIDEPSVQAQVVQQLSNGEIKFDLDAGHMISKELNWDETVVGFQGNNSLMEYRARMTERLVDNIVRTARK